jgi:hypothetical protein
MVRHRRRRQVGTNRPRADRGRQDQPGHRQEFPGQPEIEMKTRIHKIKIVSSHPIISTSFCGCVFPRLLAEPILNQLLIFSETILISRAK